MLPSLFFTADIRHAHDLAAVLRGNGVKVYPLSGKTPDQERRRLIAMFKDGEIDGMASCAVFDEGTDLPMATGGFMARPTRSGLRYRQNIGRLLRPYPAPQGARGYQAECLQSIEDHWHEGILNQLITLSTGLGKTYIAACIPSRFWLPSGRLMFLVHRDELVYQAAETYQRLNSGLKVGIEKAEQQADGADIVIASVQTLGPERSRERLAKFRTEQFSVVVVDEAHHSAKGESYQAILRHFRVLKGQDRDPQILLLGLTATPNRSDNIGLEHLFDKIVYTYGIREGIRDGWLCDIKARRVETEVDISQVKISQGDFAVAQLSSTINTPERNEIVARKYLEIRSEEGLDAVSNLGQWRKPCAYIVDFCDLSRKHSLITTPTLFGLSHRYDAKGKSITEDAEKIERLEAKHPNLNLRTEANMDGITATLRQVDLLQVPEIPSEVRGASGFPWLKESEGAYHLSLMDSSMLSIREDALGKWEIYRHQNGVRTKLWVARDMKEALVLSEKYVPAQQRMAMRTRAHWRAEPPSEKQAWKLWQINRKIRQEFGKLKDFYTFCLKQYQSGNDKYSKGGLSSSIDSSGRNE